jgi:sarcosine oxidase subunit beta
VDEIPPFADVVVVGGGIVGAASAFWLAGVGLQPLLIERAKSLAAATTAASAHCIRAQFSEPENVAMMRESLAIFEDFPALLKLSPAEADIGLTQQGYLFASTEEAHIPVFRGRVERQRALGLDDVELLDGDEVQRRFAWITPSVVVATFRRRDGWIDGCQATTLFAQTANCPILLGTAVERIETKAGRVQAVHTSRGRIATELVVLATGPFAQELAGEPLPIATVRRHRVIVSPNTRIPQSAPLTIDADTGAHWRPHAGGALLAWAQLEASSPATWPVPVDPTFPDLILRDPSGVGRLSPFWRELALSLRADDIALTAGQYTITPDRKPLIGAASQTAGLWLHTGYSGHGIMGSPSGGRLLADLIVGRTDQDQNPFSPQRFDAGATPPDVERILL